MKEHFRLALHYSPSMAATERVVQHFLEAISRDCDIQICPTDDDQIRQKYGLGGRRSNAACRYVMYKDRVPAGAYGSWRTGLEITGFGTSERPLSPMRETNPHNWRCCAMECQMSNDDATMADGYIQNGACNHRAVPNSRQHEGQTPITRMGSLAGDIWQIANRYSFLSFSTTAHNFVGLEIRQSQKALLILIFNEEGQICNLLRFYPDGRAYLLADLRVIWGTRK